MPLLLFLYSQHHNKLPNMRHLLPWQYTSVNWSMTISLLRILVKGPESVKCDALPWQQDWWVSLLLLGIHKKWLSSEGYIKGGVDWPPWPGPSLMAMWFQAVPLTASCLTTVWIWTPPGACEEVASDLGLGSVSCWLSSTSYNWLVTMYQYSRKSDKKRNTKFQIPPRAITIQPFTQCTATRMWLVGLTEQLVLYWGY